ncbi:MAG: electron transfer flavoprotein subunit alpha/FixB family protein [Pseudomonadota bacterium]
MTTAVYIELEDNKIKKANLGSLTAANSAGGDIVAIVFAENVDSFMEELKKYSVNKIIKVWSDDVKTYQPDVYAELLSKVITDNRINDLLGLATAQGKDLLPRVAAKLNASVVIDCLDIDFKNATVTKPMFASKVLSKIKLNNQKKVYALRPNVVNPVEKEGADLPEVVDFYAGSVSILAQVKEVIKAASEKIDLTEAEIIISGGRGMGSAENFKLLDDTAKILNAAVGASRAAVDADYATMDMQVGQTGKVVNPVLYIACGISGAIQHLAGMKTSKVIVAINNDAEAPIFKVADYGIVGDLFDVVPVLAEELKKVVSN